MHTWSRQEGFSLVDPRAPFGPVGSVGFRADSGRPRPAAAIRGVGGFTLLEMLLVVTIIAMMAAVSVPAILSATAHAKLRGASSSLAGFVQSSRMEAVKRNKTLTVHFVTTQGAVFAVARDADDTSSDLEGGSSQVQLGSSTFHVAIPTEADAPPLTEAILSYTPLNLPDRISLGPRGLPCRYASGKCTPAGFVYYLTDSSQRNAWTAVSISPGGRVKQWFWNSRAWVD